MRTFAGALLLSAVCVYGRSLQAKENDAQLSQKLLDTPQLAAQQADDTLISLGGDQSGVFQVTGMLQNFQLDRDDIDPVNQLLERPRTSYLDVSWSNWVDQRLELLDVLQSVMTPRPRPRCQHMAGTGSALDNGMVSYLASSRFGPAILTTYSQAYIGEGDEDDFDYGDVFIPSGQQTLGKSYEDASILEEMNADADRAFKVAEMKSRILGQQSNMGYFGANVKSKSEKAGLDVDDESLQPMILTHPKFLNLDPKGNNEPLRPELPTKEAEQQMSESDMAQFGLFCLLMAGCLYVWGSLFWSLFSMCKEGKTRDSKNDISSSQADILKPLMPEGSLKEVN